MFYTEILFKMALPVADTDQNRFQLVHKMVIKTGVVSRGSLEYP